MFYKKQEKGFTVIEMVIAIVLLSVAVIGVYNAFSRILIVTAGINDNFIAAYLAQEGVEIARNIRDNNWIAGADWNDKFSVCNPDCIAEYDSTIFQGWTGQNLYLTSDGFYTYTQTGNTETKFKRKISITPVEKDDGETTEVYALKVAVTVYWDEKGVQDSLTAEDHLYNWY